MMMLGFGFAGAMGGFRGDGVFVYAIEEAFDYAEGDESAHVDPLDGSAVLDTEAFHALAWFERAV